MGIWALVIDRLGQNIDVNVAEFLNRRDGYVCSACGHFAISRKAVEDHCGMKHRNGAECRPCTCAPAIRAGEGEGDDPSLTKQIEDVIKETEPKHGTWTKEEAEETGIRWLQELRAEWNQGVQEKQISREEMRRIRKDGSFPIFIQNSIIPMWKA
jgi:hypothetical protein